VKPHESGSTSPRRRCRPVSIAIPLSDTAGLAHYSSRHTPISSIAELHYVFVHHYVNYPHILCLDPSSDSFFETTVVVCPCNVCVIVSDNVRSTDASPLPAVQSLPEEWCIWNLERLGDESAISPTSLLQHRFKVVDITILLHPVNRRWSSSFAPRLVWSSRTASPSSLSIVSKTFALPVSVTDPTTRFSWVST